MSKMDKDAVYEAVKRLPVKDRVDIAKMVLEGRKEAASLVPAKKKTSRDRMRRYLENHPEKREANNARAVALGEKRRLEKSVIVVD